MIDKAKLILPSQNYDIDKLLTIEEFKPLRNSKDLQTFIRKFILNHATKKSVKSVIPDSQPCQLHNKRQDIEKDKGAESLYASRKHVERS